MDTADTAQMATKTMEWARIQHIHMRLQRLNRSPVGRLLRPAPGVYLAAVYSATIATQIMSHRTRPSGNLTFGGTTIRAV